MPASFINAECPYLPSVERVYTPSDVLALGADRGIAFYLTSLNYAQSQWRVGLPAQALLQVNRALACNLNSSELDQAGWPLPYLAMAWLMVHRVDGQFLGNPRRHFQHLATRMVEPHKQLRIARAWACWYLATRLLPEHEFPGDAKQIRIEGVLEPTRIEIETWLKDRSPANDLAAWLEAVVWASQYRVQPVPIALRPEQVSLDIIAEDELRTVHDLAHRIWPVVYPGIISDAQINYMLGKMYALDTLLADLARGVCYALFRVQDQAIGYIGCERRGQDEMFLHKLYILPEYAGTGLGAKGLAWVCDRAHSQGASRVVLRVNRANAPAIRAYRRAGFEFSHDIVADIGAGFVMDDYEMVKRLQT